MIVLDEQLSGSDLDLAIAQWYKGRVSLIAHLRLETVIKDEAIPQLLRRQRSPTFVTINARDFWLRIPASPRYCVVCFTLADEHAPRVSSLLRTVLRHPNFRTKAQRMGHVLRVTLSSISYYNHQSNQVRMVALTP